MFQNEEQIRVGKQWLMRLEETLQACSAFVLLVGRDGVGCWVGAEAQVALSRYFSPHESALRLFPNTTGSINRFTLYSNQDDNYQQSGIC